MRVACGVGGVLLLVVTTWSVLRTLVVPRGSSALNSAKNAALLAIFRGVAHRFPGYVVRDRILMWAAPLAIFTSLLMWLALFFVAYGLMMYASSDLTLPSSFREAGSSLFTLGYATNERANLTALDFLAATTGPITIALLIGYLPTLYTEYQRRESEVTLLLARSGEPNWGPELLARQAIVNTVPRLHGMFERWERWAAEVAESHTNFPVLIQMRSARPQRNWLIALLSVMDAAAMNLALNPSDRQDSARLLLRQGFTCMRELALVEGIAFDEDPSPDTPSDISLAEFTRVCADLAAAGFAMERTVEEAYAHFRGWRANYESVAYRLAATIDAVPAPWSGPRHPPLPVVYPQRPLNRTPGGGSGTPR